MPYLNILALNVVLEIYKNLTVKKKIFFRKNNHQQSEEEFDITKLERLACGRKLYRIQTSTLDGVKKTVAHKDA